MSGVMQMETTLMPVVAPMFSPGGEGRVQLLTTTSPPTAPPADPAPRAVATAAPCSGACVASCVCPPAASQRSGGGREESGGRSGEGDAAAADLAAAPLLPALPSAPPAAAGLDDVQAGMLRDEVQSLRQELRSGGDNVWNAVRMISQAVDGSRAEMRGLTQDVATLRGRQGGTAPLAAAKTECSALQSSCLECLSASTCVWCKIEQRCYSGGGAGPGRGECDFFDHGTCTA